MGKQIIAHWALACQRRKYKMSNYNIMREVVLLKQWSGLNSTKCKLESDHHSKYPVQNLYMVLYLLPWSDTLQFTYLFYSGKISAYDKYIR